MAEIQVLPEKCIGCRKCLPACPYGAISMQGRIAVISEACVFCGACVPACRYEAIELRLPQAIQPNSQARGIWVFAEFFAGQFKQVTFELLGEARRLAASSGEPVCAIVLGERAAQVYQQLWAYGADAVLVVPLAELDQRDELLYPLALAQLAQAYQPSIFLIGGTAFGRSIAPRIASRLETGLTADCTRLEIDTQSGLLHQTRPAFGGNLMATILCRNRRPQMATVRPHVMQPIVPDFSRRGSLTLAEVHLPGNHLIQQLALSLTTSETLSLESAEVVIGVGRGIGSPRALPLFQNMAQALNAGLAASRAVVDLGWLPYAHQVGQTGITISPKVYLAFGISGAVQHLAGLAEGTYIIAVNKDPHAPIFQVADERVVADCIPVAEALLSELKRKPKVERIA